MYIVTQSVKTRLKSHHLLLDIFRFSIIRLYMIFIWYDIKWYYSYTIFIGTVNYMIWWGVMWYAMWHDKAWQLCVCYGIWQCDVIYDFMWCHVMRHDTDWHTTVQYGIVRHDAWHGIWCDIIHDISFFT